MRSFVRTLLAAAAGVFSGISSAGADRSPATDLAPLVGADEIAGGARVRAVWVRSVGNPADSGGWDGKSHQIAGFDSRDGEGERLIIGEPANYFRPLLTHDGERVVFSNRHTKQTFIVDFAGGKPELIGQGVAGALWLDPETGKEHVIAQLDPQNFASPLIRYAIGEPQTAEVVWGQSEVEIASPGSLQVSRDGRRIASVFPWPQAGAAELPNVAWTKLTNGCWPGIAPDNSYLTFVFDGAHRFMILFDPDEPEPRRVRINNVEALANYEVYHPRWTNHARHLVLTGPYSAGEGKIRIGAGGNQVEVYLARFDEALTRVEAWARITDNEFADFFPDVWVEGGGSFELAGRQHEGERLVEDDVDWAATWPGTKDGLVFLWKNNRASNQFPGRDGKMRQSRIEAHGAARFGPRYEMDLIHGGYFSAPGLDAELLARCAASNEFSLEAVVTSGDEDQDGPARIVTFSKGRSDRNFTLGQVGDRLVVRLKTSGTGRNGFEVPIGEIEAGETAHVLVSYAPGSFRAYVNGKETVNSGIESGDFSTWIDDGGVLFGNEKTLDRPWRGKLEGVAIYDRAIGPVEAARKAELYGKVPPRMPEMVVEAKRLTRDDPPQPQDIAPYRRALSVNAFEIGADAASPLAGQRVLVAEWSLLDGEVPASYAAAAPGEAATLVLDPLEAHPQLESERLLTSGDDAFEQIYYSLESGR